MISLKQTQEESDETLGTPMEKRPYSYGTCINLDDAQVEALGIGKLAVGTKVKIVAFGVIESARVEVGEEQEAPYLSIQLTDMEAGAASSVNASAMYPSSKE